MSSEKLMRRVPGAENLIAMAQDYQIAREAEPFHTEVHALNACRGNGLSPEIGYLRLDLEVNGERRVFIIGLSSVMELIEETDDETAESIGDWDDEEAADTSHPGHPSNYGDQ